MVDNLTGQPARTPESLATLRLHPEIWHVILVEIIGPDVVLSELETRQTLCNLSRLSRALHAITNVFLCDTVYFRTTASFNAYVHYIETKDIRPPTRLTLDLREQSSEASEANPNLALKTFFTLAAERPRLRILNLRGPVSVEHLHLIAHIKLEQYSRITEPEPFDFPHGAPRPRPQWWSSSLRRLCLGPAQIWDIALYIGILSKEHLRQVVIQCDSMQDFIERSIVGLGTAALLEAITSTVAKRQTPEKVQFILVERVRASDLSMPALVPPDDEVLRVMRTANMHRVDDLQCSGLRLYDREMRCEMNLALPAAWTRLGELATEI